MVRGADAGVRSSSRMADLPTNRLRHARRRFFDPGSSSTGFFPPWRLDFVLADLVLADPPQWRTEEVGPAIHFLL
jgi:hypothetical protein